jgi:hypothetical protein
LGLSGEVLCSFKWRNCRTKLYYKFSAAVVGNGGVAESHEKLKTSSLGDFSFRQNHRYIEHVSMEMWDWKDLLSPG